jgi:hypothetical protein
VAARVSGLCGVVATLAPFSQRSRLGSADVQALLKVQICGSLGTHVDYYGMAFDEKPVSPMNGRASRGLSRPQTFGTAI